jgi:hypothetical protein
MAMTDSNGFSEYKQMLLDDRRENRKAHDALFNELSRIHDDVLTLKLKMKLFSAGWGALGAGVVLALNFLIALQGCS